MTRSRTILITVLAAWALLLLASHRGSRSPYSYIYGLGGTVGGTVDRVVNRDALTVVPVTRFFYDGSPAEWSHAHNMKLPFHSFAVATVAAFVRPYLLANDVTNFVFIVLLIVAGVRLAARFAIRDRAMLLAFATVLALPAFVAYLGQPMQYIVGPVINYVVILTALALPEEDLRNPWISGALTAILPLNYDWYVFGAALAIYVLAVLRFRSKRDDLIYLAVAITPVLVWRFFLQTITTGTASTAIRDAFIETVLVEWAEFFRDPMANLLMPFIASHTGLHMSVYQIMGLIYWPLIAACAFALWRVRATFAGNRLVVLLVVFFFAEQLATAVFDVENNPRRALPLVLVFAWLYTRAVDAHVERRGWLAAFAALFAMTAFLAFADVTLRKPGAGYLYIGPALNAPPKRALLYEPAELKFASSVDPEYRLPPFPRARLGLPAAFAFAQCFVGFWLLIWLILARRAALLPRFAPHVFGVIWLLSAVRFL